jgi:thiol-disulfide isomerase/thioredoxin
MDYKKEMDQAMSFEEYQRMFEAMVKEGKTTQADQKESYINYTKLNWSRSKRAIKSLENEDLNLSSNTVNKLKFLVITEPWCGDSAFGLPVIAKFAQELGVNLKIALRDENLDLIDAHLTTGGRSIPKLIVLDENNQALKEWGPRPKELQDLIMDWKHNQGMPMDEMNILVQKWYNSDKGLSIVKELKALLDL